MAYGLWHIDYRLWHIDYGISTVAYRLWHMDYGISTMAYRLWHIDHGSSFAVTRSLAIMTYSSAVPRGVPSHSRWQPARARIFFSYTNVRTIHIFLVMQLWPL